MIGRLNDDLVRPNSVHAIEHAVCLAVQRAFDTQGGKLVGHDSNRPSWSITLRRLSAIWVRAIGLNLGRGLALVPIIKGAESALDLHILADKIGWALGPVRRNNHPTAHNRIFSQLRQLLNPFRTVTPI